MKKMFLTSCILVVAFLSLAISPVFAAQIAVRAGAGGAGGGWYNTFAGVAEVVAHYDPEINMQVVPGSGLANLPRLGEKQLEFSLSFIPFTLAAYKGEDPFPAKYDNIRSVATGFGDNYIQIVVDESVKANTFTELMEQKPPIKLAVERVGTSDEWIFRKILGYYKADYNTIKSWGGKVTHAGYGDQSVLMKDRQIEFMLGMIAVPWTAVMEASIGRNLHMLNMTKDLQEYLWKNFALKPTAIPAGGYKFMKEDVQSISCAVQIVCHKDVPEDVVYRVTKAICENPDRVRAINETTKNFDSAKAWEGGQAPLHPGAEKYYREKGYIK